MGKAMIIISPYAQKLPNGQENPKNYPYWKELLQLITEPVIQIGVEGEAQLVDDFRKNLPFSELTKLVNEHKIKDVIVVGIGNTGMKRHREYFPQKPFESLTTDQQDFINKSKSNQLICLALPVVAPYSCPTSLILEKIGLFGSNSFDPT